MTEIVKEDRKKPVQLLLKNVEYNSERGHYIGEIVGDISYRTFTREAVEQMETIQCLSRERELWEVKPYSIHYCFSCNSDALYDEQEEEYYCPVC